MISEAGSMPSGPSETVQIPGSFGVETSAEFRQRGLVKLPGFLPGELLVPVRDRLYQVLERAEVCRDRSWIAERVSDPESFLAYQSQLQKRLKASSQEILSSCNLAELHAPAEELAQEALQSLVELPQLLFTAPNAEHWSLPTSMWHVDVPRLGGAGCPGVQMFTFVDEVLSGAGGTVVIAGSHHYANDSGRLKSKLVKKQLRQTHPWFKQLFDGKGVDDRAYLDTPTRDGPVELQVVELTGQPGDVYFMDIRMIHSLAPNASDFPRLMLTQRYFATKYGKNWYGGTE